MKAFRIISSEYSGNQPSIFLFVEGEYYGDLDYPCLRNYPQNIEYWKTATCADSDRYFSVMEVEITEEQVKMLKKHHVDILASMSMLKEYSRWKAGMTKKEREEDEAYNRSVYEHNKRYDTIISERMYAVESLIKSL